MAYRIGHTHAVKHAQVGSRNPATQRSTQQHIKAAKSVRVPVHRWPQRRTLRVCVCITDVDRHARRGLHNERFHERVCAKQNAVRRDGLNRNDVVISVDFISQRHGGRRSPLFLYECVCWCVQKQTDERRGTHAEVGQRLSNGFLHDSVDDRLIVREPVANSNQTHKLKTKFKPGKQEQQQRKQLTSLPTTAVSSRRCVRQEW